DGVGAQHAFVRLARNRTGLATFSIDKANNRPSRPCQTGRAGRPGGAREPPVALSALGGDLLLASPKRQGRRQQQDKEPANLHAASLDIRLISGHEIRTASCSLKRPRDGGATR